jgi:hypothetical protein
MTTAFDSFDGSELGEFVESPLGERNSEESQILLWFHPADEITGRFKSVYEPMGVKCHDQGNWTGNGGDYGLILSPFLLNAVYPWRPGVLRGMRNPRRIYLAMEKGSAIGGLTCPSVRYSPTGIHQYVAAPFPESPLTEGVPSFSIADGQEIDEIKGEGSALYRDAEAGWWKTSLHNLGGIDWIGDGNYFLADPQWEGCGNAIRLAQNMWTVPNSED